MLPAKLLVNITKRSINNTHEILELVFGGVHIRDVDSIRKLLCPAAHHGCSTSHDLHPVVKILALPDSPETIDATMKNPERGIIGRSVEISARVRTNGEMSSSVYTHTATGSRTLESVLETANVTLAGDERGEVAGCSVAGAEIWAKVAAQAPWVVAKSIGAWIFRWRRVCYRRYWPLNIRNCLTSKYGQNYPKCTVMLSIVS